MRKVEYEDVPRLCARLLDEIESTGATIQVMRNGKPYVRMEPVAEKLSALKTESYLQERAARGNVDGALAILDKAGRGHLPPPEDDFASGEARPGLKVVGQGRRVRGGKPDKGI